MQPKLTAFTFDPSLLENDAYTLRLTAIDAGGNVVTQDEIVSVADELKLGNFQLSFTDLTIPVTGIPISVTRTYDTLTSNTTDDFGYGWRLEFRDTDLRTSLPKDETFEQLGVRTVGFEADTRVYITLPGGQRQGFTFRPREDSRFNLIAGPTSARLFHPEFVADDGVTSTLTVEDATLVRGAGTNEFFGVNGEAYNPADGGFGGVYTLTTKEGIVYKIDGQSGDLLSVTDTNGNTLTYTDSAITSSTGQQVTFERDAQGRITTVTDPVGNQVTYEYDALGDLVAVTDREGNVTQFRYDETQPHYLDEVIDPLGRSGVQTEYNEQGRLTKLLDVNGEAVELTYDPENSVQTVKDVLGNSTTYEYDERGNIVTEIDALGGITRWTYDDDNNVLSEIDPDGVISKYTYDDRGNALTIEDGDGNLTRTTYDQNGRVLAVVSPTGLTVSAKYDSRGNLISSTDAKGLTSTTTFDSKGRPILQVGPDGQTTEWGYDQVGNPVLLVDSQGNRVVADYDANGILQSANSQFTLNGQTYTLTTNFTYDREGRTLANSNSLGNTHSTVYNSLGQVTSTTDILGNTTSYLYDDKGHVIQITLPDNTSDNPNDNPKVTRQYNAAGQVISETSATGLETRYLYDPLGRLIETILPDLTPLDDQDNPRLTTEYTKGSRVKARSDIFGNFAQYEYNHLGQLISEQNVLGNITSYTYNTGGNLTSLTDPRNRTTSFIYDDKARLIETAFFDNTKISVTYDEFSRLQSETNELGQTTHYEYDAFGQVSAVTNALDEQQTFEYDQRRNLVKVTDALGQSTQFEYDQYARRVATTYHTGDRVETTYDQFHRVTSVTDENLNTTQYFYNNLSQLTAIELANQARTEYRYNNLGLLTQVHDANDNTTRYEYDAFNRSTATILPLGQRSQTQYDNFGLIASTTDFNGDTIHYAYDQYGRIGGKTFTDPDIASVSFTYDPVTSQLLTVSDGRGITQYSYDEWDRLASVIQPDGQSVEYGYDVLSNLTSLTTQAGTTNYSYDALNRLDTVAEVGKLLADYDYDAAGNLVLTTLGDGTKEVRQYDGRNRLTQIQTTDASGLTIAGYTYTLDGVGNRINIEEHSGRTVNYTYDVVNRLTEEQIIDSVVGNRTFSYSYDLVGNRLSRNDSIDGLTTYTYDENNRLTETMLGNRITQFTYDDNGSMLSRTDGDSTITYDWINDGENRLVGVTLSDSNGSAFVEYIYDAFGNRVASIADGERTNYLISDGYLSQVLLEYSDDGQIITEYTYGIDRIRSVNAAGEETFYHQDGLGSTRMLTDDSGQVTDRYVYDAYGKLLDHFGSATNDFQFAGEQRDPNTGLDYLRARYYDPDLGRFISKDPFSGVLTDPFSQHDYQYAHANPVRYTDPTGYYTLAEAVTATALVGIAGSIWSSVGYVGYQYLSGNISASDIYGLYGQWAAGFGHGVTGGISTDLYSLSTGKVVKPTNDFLYTMGMVAGISTSVLIGFKVVANYSASIGAASWAAVYEVTTAGYGAGKSIAGLTSLDDGKATWSDYWNLLGLLPIASLALGARKGLAAAQSVQDATANPSTADDAIQSLTQTQTTVSSKNANEISLGIGGGFDGHTNPELLVKFSDNVEAPHYNQWPEWNLVSMTDDAGFMGDTILGKMRSANKIHFNLDGFSLENYQAFLNNRAAAPRVTERLSFWDIDTKNITNWEYNQIITNDDLFNKTVFYDKGGVVRLPEQVYRGN